jgi:hypothetical protein
MGKTGVYICGRRYGEIDASKGTDFTIPYPFTMYVPLSILD